MCRPSEMRYIGSPAYRSCQWNINLMSNSNAFATLHNPDFRSSLRLLSNLTERPLKVQSLYRMQLANAILSHFQQLAISKISSMRDTRSISIKFSTSLEVSHKAFSEQQPYSG
uniref:Secreted protein n=1 Tax=Parascaris univalens TaxID=6257 RepID=A0A915A3C1_PARUN